MNGTVAVQALVSGLGTGAAYGLIALGFTSCGLRTALRTIGRPGRT